MNNCFIGRCDPACCMGSMLVIRWKKGLHNYEMVITVNHSMLGLKTEADSSSAEV